MALVYVLTFRRADRTATQGTTSPSEALNFIRYMGRERWMVERIRRSAEQIDGAELARDAEREKAGRGRDK